MIIMDHNGIMINMMMVLIIRGDVKVIVVVHRERLPCGTILADKICMTIIWNRIFPWGHHNIKLPVNFRTQKGSNMARGDNKNEYIKT